MPDLTAWGLFVVASVVLLLTPTGPAVLYIVARSVEQGAAGLVSVLGIHLGTIVHIIAAAVGLVVSSALRATGRSSIWASPSWAGHNDRPAFRRGGRGSRRLPPAQPAFPPLAGLVRRQVIHRTWHDRGARDAAH